MIDSLNEGHRNINRKDLRYVVIDGKQMYVYTSKKNDLDNSTMEGSNDSHNSVKILQLSKDMKIEMRFVSKHHGQCICVIDTKTSKIACTLLPVQLSAKYFRDDGYSQIVGSKRFKKIRKSLFGMEEGEQQLQEQSSYYDSEDNEEILNDISNHSNNENEKENETPGYQKKNTIGQSSSSSWPMTIQQMVPEQQNTTAICLQFALDAARHA